MLRHLTIQNLAVVESLDLAIETGMTTLTGETGAGKSILIDALGLCLGARAESSMVRPGKDQASVSAEFEVTKLKQAQSWLETNEFGTQECILRRTLGNDGRSRAYINGQPVPIAQLKELGEMLVNIHGQHQHQALLKPEHQRDLLDHFAQHEHLLEAVSTGAKAYHQLKKEQEMLQGLQGQEDKLALLRYQIKELEELALQENELQALEEEHRKLTHAEQYIGLASQIIAALKVEGYEAAMLSSDHGNLGGKTNRSGTRQGSFHGRLASENAIEALQSGLSLLHSLQNSFPKLNAVTELFNNALVQAMEAYQEMQAFRESLTLDPERLQAVEARLDKIHGLARKHRILPELLKPHYELLCKEAEKIEDIQGSLEGISQKILDARETYLKAAKILRDSRKKCARDLSKSITESMHKLEMSQGTFEVRLSENDHFTVHGSDEIEFLVTTNPGHPLAALRKIASGGELSRISLAIQVITAQKMTTPTLIFDEVDVGVSGKTAEIVGKLMRQLAAHTQVLCVTHLPQVAAQGHHHFKVEKVQEKNNTSTRIYALDIPGKIAEIARLLGGVKITKNTLTHAEEMLENAMT